MAVDFADTGEGESEVDTLDGAQPSELAMEAVGRRAMYNNHMAMTRADGTPILSSGPTAQDLLNQETQRAAYRAAHPRPVQRQPMPQHQQEEAFDEVLGGYAEERAEEAALMSEAEHRFDKAKYYRLLLGGHSMFNDVSPAGQEVEAEIRAFAKERFEVFLGMRQERGAVPAVFEGWTSEDFTTLLALVRRLQNKPELLTPTGPRPEPTINRAGAGPAVPSQEVAEPTLRTVAVPSAPQVRQPASRPGAAPPQQLPRRRPALGPSRVTVPLVDPYTGTTKLDATGRPLQQDITPQTRPPLDSPIQPVPMATSRDAIEQLHDAKAREVIGTSRADASGKPLDNISRIATIHAQLTGTQGELVSEGWQYRPDLSMQR